MKDHSNKTISILGSTGSIGTQALEVIEEHHIKVVALAANSNVGRLAEQVVKFGAEYACIYDEKKLPALEKLLPILTISCWGFVPEDMKIVFNPIRTMSAETQMKLATEHADIVLKALEKGAITRDEARAELKAYSAKTDMFAKLA